jgi:hypothetical protein
VTGNLKNFAKFFGTKQGLKLSPASSVLLLLSTDHKFRFRIEVAASSFIIKYNEKII